MWALLYFHSLYWSACQFLSFHIQAIITIIKANIHDICLCNFHLEKYLWTTLKMVKFRNGSWGIYIELFWDDFLSFHIFLFSKSFLRLKALVTTIFPQGGWRRLVMLRVAGGPLIWSLLKVVVVTCISSVAIVNFYKHYYLLLHELHTRGINWD